MLIPTRFLVQIAFDAGQKAVLTSCVLVNQSVLSRKRKKNGGAKNREDAMINVSSFLSLTGWGVQLLITLGGGWILVLFFVYDQER